MARPWVPRTRAAALTWIALGYLLAGAVGWWLALSLTALPLWQRIAAADLAATGVIFVFSVLFDNSSFYDPYWSVAPIPIALSIACDPASHAPPLRRWLVLAAVCAWGLRLTWNWTRGWTGFAHEDWRYVDLRRKTGVAYWAVSLFGLHLMPTVTVYLGMLSLLPALRSPAPLGALDALALVITFGAIALEATADEQLRAFRRRHPDGGRIMNSGLWAHSRHPNYLGEISFWWGLYAFALAAAPHTWWWILPGPVWMTALFVFISVPLIDRRSLARRPEYAEHARRVPALLPRPWRR